MKFLVVGNGSIGKRHSDNLRNLSHCVLAYSYREGALVPNQKNPSKTSKEWQDFLTQDIDAVVVANTTNLHLEVAIEAAKMGKNIYIEKPLSTSLKNVKLLEDIVREKKIKIDTGFMLRSHPNLIWLKEHIKNNHFGDLLYLRAHVGQNIKDWRLNYDYKKSYSNKKELGGGVVFDLIHEFDLLQWFGGEILDLTSILLSHPTLDLSTETIAQVCMITKNKALAQVHLDYHRPFFSRKLEICFEEIVFNWDFLSGEIYAQKEEGKRYLINKIPYGYERNDMFIDHMKSFINTFNNPSANTRSSLKCGINALKIALATYYSSEKKVHINPKSIKN